MACLDLIMQKMMEHDKINDEIKERRNIDKFSREWGEVEGQKVV